MSKPEDEKKDIFDYIENGDDVKEIVDDATHGNWDEVGKDFVNLKIHEVQENLMDGLDSVVTGAANGIKPVGQVLSKVAEVMDGDLKDTVRFWGRTLETMPQSAETIMTALHGAEEATRKPDTNAFKEMGEFAAMVPNLINDPKYFKHGLVQTPQVEGAPEYGNYDNWANDPIYPIPTTPEELTNLAENISSVSERNRANALVEAQAAELGMTKEAYLKSMPEDAAVYLVRGAEMKCRLGSHPRRLNLPLDHGVLTTNHPMLHELNCIVGDDQNIATFGVCKGSAPTLYTKTIRLIKDESDPTKEDGENVSGRICSPNIVGVWMQTDEHVKIVDNGMLGGGTHPSTNTRSFLVCQYGGLIEPNSSGQEYNEKPPLIESKVLDLIDEGAVPPAAEAFMKKLELDYYLADSEDEEKAIKSKYDAFVNSGFKNSGDPKIDAAIAQLPRAKGILSAEDHYLRNTMNVNYTWDEYQKLQEKLPASKKWRELGDDDSQYHRIATPEHPEAPGNRKFVSADGKFEAVFTSDNELVNEDYDPGNMGTYNYSSPSDPMGHLLYDVIPYYLFDNTKK